MGVGSQRHAPAALPPGKARYPFYRRLGGPPGSVWMGAEKSQPPPGLDPRTVTPVASRYTDWANNPALEPGTSRIHVQAQTCFFEPGD